MHHKSFEIKRPNTQLGSVVFASPHSGREMPEGFLEGSILDLQQIRSSEDAFVDELYSAAPALGAPLFIAKASRAFVDLNRSADELDPSLIEGLTRKTTNPRVVSGLGVIPRVVANGRHIYQGKLTLAEAHARISGYWRPYHDGLQAMIDDTARAFGEVILVDCHSMPHEALDNVNTDGGRPDIVIGDRFGASCREDISERIATAFAARGFRVARNVPFAGAFITQHYGRPSIGRHAIQIEINRALYMDEKRIEPNAHFDQVRSLITDTLRDLIAIGQRAQRLAAE